MGLRAIDRWTPYQREPLAANDTEAIRHAMTSCRRIIGGYADAVFPVRDQPLHLVGKEIALVPSHHLHRLSAFIRDRTTSGPRRDRLRRTLSDLYGRVS